MGVLQKARRGGSPGALRQRRLFLSRERQWPAAFDRDRLLCVSDLLRFLRVFRHRHRLGSGPRVPADGEFPQSLSRQNDP